MRALSLLFFLFLGQCLLAQASKGVVVDSETGDPLIGASILWDPSSSADSIFTTSNAGGEFTLGKSGESGTISIDYLGYRKFTLVVSSLQPVTKYMLTIDEGNIAANPIIVANPFVTNQVRFNRKEFQVLPGAYEDPSRLMIKAPGFTTANDQANSILYKGFPASFVGWTVNDAYVVNPNHLSNAGSLSDVSSVNAGGVNMMSGQVIGTYEFNAPNSFPNFMRLAGNSNISPTEYNRNYLNLSLIGLEAGYGVGRDDGPNVHVNYRYSTVGLLTGPLGLDFGGEQIQYQDVFSRFTLVNKPGMSLKGFAGYGWSENDKREVTEPEEGELTFKDSQEILFKSGIFLSGLRLEKETKKGVLESTINFSNKTDERNSSGALPVLNNQRFSLNHSMVSAHVAYKLSTWEFGYNGFVQFFNERNRWEVADIPSSLDIYDRSHVSNSIYATYFKQWNRFSLKAGLAATSFIANEHSLNLKPHIEASYEANTQWSVTASYRRNGQALDRVISRFLPREEVLGDHRSLKITYKKPKLLLYTELFSHTMTKLSVLPGSTFSIFTGNDYLEEQPLSDNGRAFSRGIGLGGNVKSVGLENLDISASGSFFDAQYSNGSSFFESPFSFRNSLNILITYRRELRRDKEWIVSWSLHRRGGLKELPIDLEKSNERLRVIYDHSDLETRTQLRDYVRMDGRVLYNLRKGTHRRFAKSISLDIQNLASRENDAFTNVNYLTGETFVQKQLGLIPVLAYRIEF